MAAIEASTFHRKINSCMTTKFDAASMKSHFRHDGILDSMCKWALKILLFSGEKEEVTKNRTLRPRVFQNLQNEETYLKIQKKS